MEALNCPVWAWGLGLGFRVTWVSYSFSTFYFWVLSRPTPPFVRSTNPTVVKKSYTISRFARYGNFDFDVWKFDFALGDAIGWVFERDQLFQDVLRESFPRKGLVRLKLGFLFLDSRGWFRWIWTLVKVVRVYYRLDDLVDLVIGVMRWCGPFPLDPVWMSSWWMKFRFFNFIRKLALVDVLDDKVNHLFGKRFQAPRRWCTYPSLKIVISKAPNMECSLVAFA